MFLVALMQVRRDFPNRDGVHYKGGRAKTQMSFCEQFPFIRCGVAILEFAIMSCHSMKDDIIGTLGRLAEKDSFDDNQKLRSTRDLIQLTDEHTKYRDFRCGWSLRPYARLSMEKMGLNWPNDSRPLFLG